MTNQQFARELILNTIAVEAARKVQWEQYAAHLMAKYGITQAEVGEYVSKHGPLIKPLLLEVGVSAPNEPAVREAVQFMQQMKQEKNVSPAELTIRLARSRDRKEESLLGSSELILQFARANNPVEKFIYFFRLMFKSICTANQKGKNGIKPDVEKKSSRGLFHELITLGLTFITIYLAFPYLPGIVFRQSVANALEFTFYWAIFKYIIFPTFFLFVFAMALVSLWRQDKETRKILISKWQTRLKTFAETKWAPPLSSFLFAMCPVWFMHSQRPYVFQGKSWDGLFLAGIVLWSLQMLIYFTFRKSHTKTK